MYLKKADDVLCIGGGMGIWIFPTENMQKLV